MGNVFLMRTEAHPPSGTLRNTIDTIGSIVEERHAAFRSEWSSAEPPETALRFIEEVDGFLRDIVRHRPDLLLLSRDTTTDNAVIVYQRIRILRHLAMQSALRNALARQPDNGEYLHSELNGYKALIDRACSSNASPEEVLRDAAALLHRLSNLSDGDDGGLQRCLLIGLVQHVHAAVRISNPSATARTFRTPPAVIPSDPPVPNETCAVCADAECAPRLPCGHRCMCAECAASVDRCPLCRDQYDPSEVAWADACGKSYIPAEGYKQ